jgi:hypothetical protein
MGNSSGKDRKNNEKSLRRLDDLNQKRDFAQKQIVESNKNLEESLKEMNMEKFLRKSADANDKYFQTESSWVKCSICNEIFDKRSGLPKQLMSCSGCSFCKRCAVKLEFSESELCYSCPICYGS